MSHRVRPSTASAPGRSRPPSAKPLRVEGLVAEGEVTGASEHDHPSRLLPLVESISARLGEILDLLRTRRKEILTIAEVAVATGRTEGTVRRWISDGTVRGAWFGRAGLRVTMTVVSSPCASPADRSPSRAADCRRTRGTARKGKTS